MSVSSTRVYKQAAAIIHDAIILCVVIEVINPTAVHLIDCVLARDRHLALVRPIHVQKADH